MRQTSLFPQSCRESLLIRPCLDAPKTPKIATTTTDKTETIKQETEDEKEERLCDIETKEKRLEGITNRRMELANRKSELEAEYLKITTRVEELDEEQTNIEDALQAYRGE
ncbi:hypothetical protein G7046_g1887 [Stylonectria norvegica]|nr:hypothetical protein G7046_g1887 [Stylonectria norvegica]